MESTNEIYFVETEAIRILNEFHSSLAQLTFTIQCRNEIMKVKYENLMPALIPTSEYQYSTIRYYTLIIQIYHLEK